MRRGFLTKGILHLLHFLDVKNMIDVDFLVLLDNLYTHHMISLVGGKHRSTCREFDQH